jgi:hypothetical protein
MRKAVFLILFAFTTPTLSFAQDPPPISEEAAPEDAEDEAAPKDADDSEEGEDPLPEVDVPEDDEEALNDVLDAVGALQTGQWATFAILLIGLLLFGYNRWTASKAAAESTDTTE